MKIGKINFVLSFFLISGIYGMMPGGVSEIPVNSPDVIRLSQIAMFKLNEGRLGAEDNSRDLVEVVKATKQIVSGTLTTLIIQISEGGVRKICEVKIWEQPWLNKIEITHLECVDESEEINEKEKSSIPAQDDNDDNEELSLQSFNSFMRKYNKNYPDDEEFEKRYKIFQNNLNKIKLLRETERGTAEYGVSWFADLTTEELVNYLGFRKGEGLALFEVRPSETPDISLPDNFDWKHYNAVTPVKDQKNCGSCWAFSVTGNIEGQWAIKTGKLLSLSEQELIDCDKKDHGCNGGFMTSTFRSIIELGGLVTEEDYPYEAKKRKCRLDKSEVKVKISDFVRISDDEPDMAKWLVKNGPISAGLNAEAMAYYKQGISHPISHLCSSSLLNHGVLIVGFGTETVENDSQKIPYWIIKNSWGKEWGEDGYYRLYRGDGSCGINTYASSAVVS